MVHSAAREDEEEDRARAHRHDPRQKAEDVQLSRVEGHEDCLQEASAHHDRMMQGWGQVQSIEYSHTSSTSNQVQVVCFFTNRAVLKIHQLPAK